MNYRPLLGIMLLACVAGLAQDKPAASPTHLTFGDAHIVVPADWKHAETQSGANKARVLLIVPPDNTKERNLAILLLPGQDIQGAEFPGIFDTILKQGLAPNEHLVQYSELPVRKAIGYDFATRSMVVADDTGRRSVRVCLGANPGHRLEMLIISADSKETLNRYQAELSSLLGSYNFDSASVAAGTDSQKTEETPTRADSSVTASQGSLSRANTKAEQAATSGGPIPVAPGARSHVPQDGSVLLCTDPARLDGAMDFAKYGDSYNALRALRNDAFFRVNGPASLEVKDFNMKSRWPKVFVMVLDGDSAGRTGWVVLSELRDLRQAGK